MGNQYNQYRFFQKYIKSQNPQPAINTQKEDMLKIEVPEALKAPEENNVQKTSYSNSVHEPDYQYEQTARSNQHINNRANLSRTLPNPYIGYQNNHFYQSEYIPQSGVRLEIPSTREPEPMRYEIVTRNECPSCRYGDHKPHYGGHEDFHASYENKEIYKPLQLVHEEQSYQHPVQRLDSSISNRSVYSQKTNRRDEREVIKQYNEGENKKGDIFGFFDTDKREQNRKQKLENYTKDLWDQVQLNKQKKEEERRAEQERQREWEARYSSQVDKMNNNHEEEENKRQSKSLKRVFEKKRVGEERKEGRKERSKESRDKQQ